jgi:hypothetical protein
MATHLKSLSPRVALVQTICNYSFMQFVAAKYLQIFQIRLRFVGAAGYGPPKRICHDEYFERIKKPT